MDDKSNINRRSFLAASGAVTLASFAGCAGPSDNDGTTDTTPAGGDGDTTEINGFSVPADRVKAASEFNSDQAVGTLELIVNPPKSTPNDYETTKAFAKQASKLGLNMTVKTMPWPQQSDAVWFGKDWDASFWQMSGRPSRLDPDEFLMQMYHSDYQAGYNYYYWEDKEYDETVLAQRQERDQEKRQQLVKKCQQIINERGPSTFVMYPQQTLAYNKAKWDGIVDLNGMGIRNMISISNAKPKTDDKELVLSYDQEVQYLNPFNQSGEVDMIQHRQLWDRLVWPNEKALPEPRLAKELNWLDDTTLEVPIKEGGKFHNGEDLLAEDVKFSFDVHKQFDTYFSAPVDPVNEVEVVDDYRVQFHLDYPFAPFPMATLGRIPIVPKQHWEDIIENKMQKGNPMLYQEETPVGSGPLQFDTWQRGSSVRLKKFADHWDAVAYDGMTTRIIPSVQTTLTQLQKGSVHLLGRYTGDKDVLKKACDESDDLEFKATTSVGFKQMSYNCDNPPMNIAGFRRAMHHSFDPELTVQQIYSGWGEHGGHSPTSTALKTWHNTDLEPYPRDIQQAANQLVEAGFMWDEDGNLYMPADRTELKDSEIAESKPKGTEQG